MSINLNSEIIETMPAPLALASRALHYGDGLFETIRVFSGKAPFMHLHWQRLEAGLNILGFEIPSNWSAAFFENEILRLGGYNARVRLTVWRESGGLFFPSGNKPNFLITATPLDSNVFTWQETGLNVRQCERIRLPVDALSGLKTLGSTRYVLAAIEAREKGADDVIVLNERGNVCEATSSNVFWIKNETLFAPAPTDGQVSGTFQKILCAVLRHSGTQVVEKHTTFAALMESDEIFFTNAIQGIRWVRFLEGKEFGCKKTIYFNNLMVKHLEGILGL